MDQPLKWRVGRTQAVAEISGTDYVIDVVPGTSYLLTVDHSDDAQFALAEPPRVEPVEGVAFVLCCDGTGGGQFTLMVMVADAYIGDYYEYGGPEPDVTVNWTRRGVLDGDA